MLYMLQQERFEGIGKGTGEVMFMYLGPEVDPVFSIVEAVHLAGQFFDVVEPAYRPPLVPQIGPHQEWTGCDCCVQVLDITYVQDAERKG